MPYLPCVETELNSPAKAAVIWLHGLGANGHDFEPIIPELDLPANLAIRFVFPHAPSIPVTVNGGYVMPAWYDILEMDFERKIDEQQLKQSVRAIKALIDREIERGIKSEDILLIGFSQGGAVAYEAALTYDKPLAGLLALSTYFATHKSIALSPANKNLPIRIFHGMADPVVPEQLGQNAYKALLELGFEPQYKRYPMEHEVCAEEIADISQWVQSCLL